MYAKYTDQSNIERENLLTRVICSEELYDIYYSGNNSRFLFSITVYTILLPSVSLFIFIASVRKWNANTMKVLNRPSNHSTVVALAFLGAKFTLFVLIADILAASAVATNDHEYATEVTGSSINLIVVYITLVFDLIFSVPLLLCILYILYLSARTFFGLENNCTCNKFLRVSCGVIIGKSSLKSIEKLSNAEAIAVIFPLMFASPLLCLSSHIGYMLLAWITEPGKGTSNLILVYIFAICFFIALRKIYTQHSDTKMSLKCKHQESNEGNAAEGNTNEIIEFDVIPKDGNKSDDGKDISQVGGTATVSKKSRYVLGVLSNEADKDYINPQAMCLVLFYSFFITGIAVIIIAVLVFLPISTDFLILYLSNAVQLMVVFISTYFAFQLFFVSDFNLREALESFRAHYAQKGDSNESSVSIAKNKDVDLEVATGALAAELAHVVQKKEN